MAQNIKRILAATDMSARSDRALERAFEIAGRLGLSVDVLMVLDDALPEEMLTGLHDKAKSQLETMCDRWSGGVEFSISVQAGDPTQVLIGACEPADETLLVMGAHRPRAIFDALRETTMQRVARLSSTTVLLARGPVAGPYQAILSLVDFGPASTAGVTLAHKLAPEAPIKAAHAIHVPYSGMLETTGAVQLDLQAAFLKDAKAEDAAWRARHDLPPTLTPETVMHQAAPLGLVHETVREEDVDLITAGAHGRVGSGRALMGSLASDLMRDPPCDVLIARA